MGSGSHIEHEAGTSIKPKKLKEEEGVKSSKFLDFGTEDIEHAEMERPSSGYSASRSLRTPRMPSTLEDFEVLSTIGSGSYGTCKKIRRKKDGKILVWKEMEYGTMTESEKQMLVSEVNLLRELKHQHIVRYYDRIIDRSKTTIYIIMEYCDGGDLAQLISSSRRASTFLEEDFIWKMLIQMTSALKECHRRKNGKAVLHRDLKPANIFLDADKNVKLGDFGLARVLHHETSFAKTYVGTPYYMSPELVNNMSYNEKSDIWAMGCMLYELCALHPPFTATNQLDLNRKICVGDYSRIPLRYTDDLNAIISKLLRVDVHTRPSIEDVLHDSTVIRKINKLERKHSHEKMEVQVETKSSHESLKSWEAELKLREKKIEMREKELKNKERDLIVREKLMEEREKRIEQLTKEFSRKTSLDRDICSAGDADLSFDGPHPCLSRGKRDPETPKKKVTFDMYGKENLRRKDKGDQLLDKLLAKDYMSKYTAEIHDYDSVYETELAKRRELKDRLYKAKTRAIELQGLPVDTRVKSRNLLYFR